MKAFLIFWEMETPKKFVILQQTGLSYISGNENPKKRLIFQKVTFRSKNKKNCSEKASHILRNGTF